MWLCYALAASVKMWDMSNSKRNHVHARVAVLYVGSVCVRLLRLICITSTHPACSRVQHVNHSHVIYAAAAAG
jgi:hypothetical protein